VDIEYKDSADPTFQGDYGIGEGCNSANGRAVPPVRLKEFADAFAVEDENNLFSVCSADYSDALEAIAKRIIDSLTPACLPACALDTDATAAGVQPSCTMEEIVEGKGSVNVPQCVAGGTGWEPPPGSDSCFVAKTGMEMDPVCISGGHNVEFDLVRREGVLPPSDSRVLATCQVSPTPSVDCPNL
jgi:hypothetical protein